MVGKSRTFRPDGGCFAWTIVAASFMVSFLQDGFRDSFGLILPAICNHFDVGRAEASLTNSLMVFLTLGSGPLAAWMVKRLGHRLTTVIGVVLSALGLIIAGLYIQMTSDHHHQQNATWHQGFNQGTPTGSVDHLEILKVPAPNILVLHISIGVMTGLGFGLMYLPAMDIVKVYFDANLGLANGIAAAGSGFGQFIMAPTINLVQEHLGLDGTMYVLAGVVAFSLLFGLMYSVPDVAIEDIEEKQKETIKESLMTMLKSPPMMFLIISHFLVHLGIFVTFTFYADRAAIFGISRDNSTLLLSIMGVSNFLGRIIFGKLLDKFRSRTFLMVTCVLLLNGISVLVSQFLTSFAGQAIISAVFGATFGAYITSLIVVISMLVDDITFPFGICLFVFALASLIGPTSVGHMYDVYGSYLPGFVVVGILAILGAAFLPLAWWAIHRRREERDRNVKC
eukprot:GFUD01019160.1.p1 GENE.GFUD01019160.1~~GFUD01019160.1.p1  ORF type:complete len:452 (+),score=88.21 GFUD01019160.1:104-1459(+)